MCKMSVELVSKLIESGANVNKVLREERKDISSIKVGQILEIDFKNSDRLPGRSLPKEGL